MPRAVLLGGDPRKKLNGYINLKSKVYADLFEVGLNGLGEILTTDVIAGLIERRMKDGQVFAPQLVAYWAEWFEAVDPFLARTAAAGARSVDDARVAVVKQQRPYPAREGALEWLALHRDFLIGHFGRQTGQSLEAILRVAAENDQWGSGTVARDLRGVIRLRPAQANRIARMYQNERETLGVTMARRNAKEREAKALRERIATVSQHETAQMWNRGALEAVKDAVAKGQMDPNTTKVWLTVGDDRVCPVCGPLHEMELELDEPYESIRGFKDQSPPAHIKCRCALAFKRRVDPPEDDESERDEPWPNMVLLGGAAAAAAAGIMAVSAARQLSLQFAWMDEMREAFQFAESPGAALMIRQSVDFAERRRRFEEAIEEARQRYPVTDTTIRLAELVEEVDVAGVLAGRGVVEDELVPEAAQLFEKLLRSRLFDEEAGAYMRSRKFTQMPALFFDSPNMNDTGWGMLQLRWLTNKDPNVPEEMAAWFNTTPDNARRYLERFEDVDAPRERLGFSDLYPRFMASEGRPVAHPRLTEIPNPEADPDAFYIFSQEGRALQELVGGEGGLAPMPSDREWYGNFGYRLTDTAEAGSVYGLSEVSNPVYQLTVKLRPGARVVDQHVLKSFGEDLVGQARRSDLRTLMSVMPAEARARFQARHTFHTKGPVVTPQAVTTAARSIQDTVNAGEMTREAAQEASERIALLRGRSLASEALSADYPTLARILGYDVVREGSSDLKVVNPAIIDIDPNVKEFDPVDWNLQQGSFHVPDLTSGVPTEILNAEIIKSFNLSYNATFMVRAEGELWFLKATDRISDGVQNEIRFSRMMDEIGMGDVVMRMGAVKMGARSDNGVIMELAPSHKRMGSFGTPDETASALSAKGGEDAFKLRTIEHMLHAADRHGGQFGITDDGRLLGFDYEDVGWYTFGDPHGNHLDAIVGKTQWAQDVPLEEATAILDSLRSDLIGVGAVTSSQDQRFRILGNAIKAAKDWEEETGLPFNDIKKFEPTIGANSNPRRWLFSGLWDTPENVTKKIDSARQKFAVSQGNAQPALAGTAIVADEPLPELVAALRQAFPDSILPRADADAVKHLDDLLTKAIAQGDNEELFNQFIVVGARHVVEGRADQSVVARNLQDIKNLLDFGQLVKGEQILEIVARDWGVPEGWLVRDLIDIRDSVQPEWVKLRFIDPEELKFSSGDVGPVGVIKGRAMFAREIRDEWERISQFTPDVQVARSVRALLGLRVRGIDITDAWEEQQFLIRSMRDLDDTGKVAQAQRIREAVSDFVVNEFKDGRLDVQGAIASANRKNPLTEDLRSRLHLPDLQALQQNDWIGPVPSMKLVDATKVPTALHRRVNGIPEAAERVFAQKGIYKIQEDLNAYVLGRMALLNNMAHANDPKTRIVLDRVNNIRNMGLQTRLVEEGDRVFETGKPVSFRFIRNKEPAPDLGDQFGQNIEPAGRYMLHNAENYPPLPGWEAGSVSFKNPLVLNYEGWKERLSARYGGITGVDLSAALRDEGFDGIVTVNRFGTAEIVDMGDIAPVGATVSQADRFDADDFASLLVAVDRIDRDPLPDIDDGLAPLRFLLDDWEADPGVALTKEWLWRLPSQVRHAVGKGIVRPDLREFDQEWLLREVARSAGGGAAPHVERRMRGLQLLLADEARNEHDFLNLLWSFEKKEDFDELLALALRRGIDRESLILYLSDRDGRLSRKLATILGQKDLNNRTIPADLGQGAARDKILKDRPVAADWGLSQTWEAQAPSFPLIAVKQVAEVVPGFKPLRRVSPIIMRHLRDKKLLARMPREIYEALDRIQGQLAVRGVPDEGAVFDAVRGGFRLAMLRRRPDLDVQTHRRIADRMMQDETVMGVEFEEWLQSRGHVTIVEQFSRQGIADTGNINVFAGLLNDKQALEASIDQLASAGVDPRAMLRVVLEYDGADLDAYDYVQWEMARFDAKNYLRGRYGLGALTDEYVPEPEVLSEYPFLEIMHANPEVALAKAWSDLAALPVDDRRVEIGRQLLVAANRAETPEDRRSLVARYVQVAEQVYTPTVVEVNNAIRDGQIYDMLGRMVQFREAALRRPLKNADVNELLDLVELGDAKGLHDAMRRTLNGVGLRLKPPGKGFIIEDLLDLAPLEERRDRVFPVPAAFDALVPDAGLFDTGREIGTALRVALSDAGDSGPWLPKRGAEELFELVPAGSVAQPDGQYNWERVFFENWRAYLARENVQIPHVRPEDAQFWYEVVDLGLDQPDVKAVAGRIRRLLAVEPTTAEVAMFERKVNERDELSWVTMLNRWIDDANHEIVRDAMQGPLARMLPGGEAWQIAGLGTDPKVKEAIRLFISSEAGSGRMTSQRFVALQQRLESATDGEGLIKVWVDAHKAARVQWPSLSDEAMDQLRARHRLKDMARRVVLVHEAAFGSALDTAILQQLNEALDDADLDAVRAILNQLIETVNKDFLLAA